MARAATAGQVIVVHITYSVSYLILNSSKCFLRIFCELMIEKSYIFSAWPGHPGDAARGDQGRESRVRRGVRSFTPSTRLDASRRGFGDYGIQAYDGERTISLEDQQDQVARHLVSFLKRVRKRG